MSLNANYRIYTVGEKICSAEDVVGKIRECSEGKQVFTIPQKNPIWLKWDPPLASPPNVEWTS